MTKNAPHRIGGRGAGRSVEAGRHRHDHSTERAERLIDQQLDVVASAASDRHTTLYRAAYAIGGALHVAETSHQSVLEELTRRSMDTGLPENEAKRTAKDGLKSGADKPLEFERSLSRTPRSPRLRPVAALPVYGPPDPGRRALALRLWSRVERDDTHVAGHPYAARKRVLHAFGAGRVGEGGRDLLCIPLKRHGVGEVLAVQTITESGEKRTYGHVEDAYLLLGDERSTRHPWIACEGWATAHAFVVANSINRTPAPVLVAFGSRLEAVARSARETYGATVVCMPDGEVFDG